MTEDNQLDPQIPIDSPEAEQVIDDAADVVDFSVADSTYDTPKTVAVIESHFGLEKETDKETGRSYYRPPVTADNPNGAGRTSELTTELLAEIKRLILQGLNNKEVCEKLDISYNTWNHWKYTNYRNFADSLMLYEQEYDLSLAMGNIREMMTMDTENTGMTVKGDEFYFNDPRLVKIKADMSVFVAETIGKNKGYTKRTEQTGKDGEPMKIELSEDIARKNGITSQS